MLNPLLHGWEKWFGEPLRQVEANSLAFRNSPAGQQFDWKTTTILVSAAAMLTLQHYTAHPVQCVDCVTFCVNIVGDSEFADECATKLRKWSGDSLSDRLWFCGVSALTYFVIPVLILKFVFHDRLRDYGLKWRGAFQAWPLYVLFMGVMGPLVWYFSGTPRFMREYPLVGFHTHEQVRQELWIWEFGYAAQFVTLEFFFRGYLIHGTKHRFGIYSVFVALGPYVLIHFSKPPLEATASIIAGVVLGFMSLATRSVWLGAGLHIAVACGMDLAVLSRRGLV